jgi:hypothetical protein
VSGRAAFFLKQKEDTRTSQLFHVLAIRQYLFIFWQYISSILSFFEQNVSHHIFFDGTNCSVLLFHCELTRTFVRTEK